MINKFTLTRILSIIVISVLFSTLAFAGYFKVIRVYDGDTLKAKEAGVGIWSLGDKYIATRMEENA